MQRKLPGKFKSQIATTAEQVSQAKTMPSNGFTSASAFDELNIFSSLYLVSFLPNLLSIDCFSRVHWQKYYPA